MITVCEVEAPPFARQTLSGGRGFLYYGKLTYNKLRVTGAYQCIMWMKFAGTKQEITIKYG